MPTKSDAAKRAQKKYLSARGRVSLYMPPADLEAIRAAAAAAGETLTGYCLEAIRARMQADAPPLEDVPADAP